MSIKNNTTSLQSLLDAINALPDGLTWKDEFVYGTAYDVNDVVSFEGSSYVCVQAVDNNSELTPNMNTESWNLIARAGTDGVSVVNVYRKSAGFGSGAANTIAVELSSGEIKTFNIYNGEQGESAAITEVTANVDASVGTPNVAVTMGGTETNRTIDFAFTNLKGEDGRTPVKGTDYYTDADKMELLEQIKSDIPQDTVRYGSQTLTEDQKAQARANIGAVSSHNHDDKYQPKGDYLTSVPAEYVTETELAASNAQLVDALVNEQTLIDNVAERVPYVKTAEQPTFVDSVDEMTDTSKMYVLKSDAEFYSYKAHTTTTPGSTVANFTNQVPLSTDTDASI